MKAKARRMKTVMRVVFKIGHDVGKKVIAGEERCNGDVQY